jgi:nucleoside-diphosphate-sugar epimerase
MNKTRRKLEQKPQRILIAGCGDVGLRTAQRLRAMGHEVTGLVRTGQSAARLQAANVAAVVDDLDSLASAGIGQHPRESGDPCFPLLFYFAPPPDDGTTDPRLRAFLAALHEPPPRIVYISTSGVYGDCAGRWITEDELLKPQTDRARRRLDAEQSLTEYSAQAGADVVILRVPGIYGPGRLPIERLRQGHPVIRAEDSPYTNRIHADDLARAAILAAELGAAGRAYNVSDGHPTTMTDYFIRCARLLGLPEPPQVSLAEARRNFTPAMLSFIEESKRLVTTRLREELGFVPRYPDLAAGLPDCLPSK